MAAEMATEKPVMVVGIDDSEHSFYALEWALEHFFTPHAPEFPFKLFIVHAKATPASAIGLAGPGAAEVLPYVEADLKASAARVVGKAKELCLSKSVNDITLEIIEGDARNVLCEAVEKLHASILVVGSHGYGAIKRSRQCFFPSKKCRIPALRKLRWILSTMDPRNLHSTDRSLIDGHPTTQTHPRTTRPHGLTGNWQSVKKCKKLKYKPALE
ncbi:hypothetical protein Ancab_021886 [Ancistrocladus abbreviatus]